MLVLTAICIVPSSGATWHVHRTFDTSNLKSPWYFEKVVPYGTTRFCNDFVTAAGEAYSTLDTAPARCGQSVLAALTRVHEFPPFQASVTRVFTAGACADGAGTERRTRRPKPFSQPLVQSMWVLSHAALHTLYSIYRGGREVHQVGHVVFRRERCAGYCDQDVIVKAGVRAFDALCVPRCNLTPPSRLLTRLG